MTLMLTVATIITILFLTGCSNSDSYSGSTYYRNYHDPYPNWGRRTVYIRHDYHDKPRPPNVRPPESRPPRPPNMGRPPNRPPRPVHRPAQRPAARRR
jgi:hypothetical protein